LARRFSIQIQIRRESLSPPLHHGKHVVDVEVAHRAERRYANLLFNFFIVDPANF
jgi:hypothetical protein